MDNNYPFYLKQQTIRKQPRTGRKKNKESATLFILNLTVLLFSYQILLELGLPYLVILYISLIHPQLNKNDLDFLLQSLFLALIDRE